MALQYVGLNEIKGSLVVLDHVKGASYDEMVEIQLKNGTTRSGRVVQIEGEKIVVQVFEGTNDLSLENTKTKLLGRPMAKPFPDSSATFACLTICTAKRSCGKPEPEKIGNFCPRIRKRFRHCLCGNGCYK